MVGEILEYDEELTIRIKFRSKIHGNPKYHYLQLIMTDGKKPKLYPEIHLPYNMERKEISEDGQDFYEYTAVFHPRNVMIINGYGGCKNFIDEIQMIEDFYITETESEKEYKDAIFMEILFEYDGKSTGGFFA